MTTWPDTVTPPLAHNVVQQITGHIKRDAIPVQVKRASRPLEVGNCYWNVAHVVKESGGDSVLGWAIRWWPEFYVVGMHHAVWRLPDRSLRDVTETHPFDKRSRFTVFLPDDSRKIELEIIPCIDNEFINISGLAAVDNYISLYKRKEAVRRRLTEINWISGNRCEAQFSIAAGEKGVAPEKIRIIGAAVAEYGALFRAFQAFDLQLGQAIESIRRAPRTA